MIVIGADVHKYSLTAAAVDELGRALSEHNGPVGGEVVAWARSLGDDRLWAVEDCRHVTRGFEQALLGEGERLVRVPRSLTAPQQTQAAGPAKPVELYALGPQGAALQEPGLDSPRAGEETLR